MYPAMAASAPLPMVDLCPLVPAACIFKGGGDVIDKINPFKSFWDAFFVSSPAEALESPLRLIWAVPRANFDAAWFRDAYSNNLAFYGLGISLAILAITVVISGLPGRSSADIVNAFADWLSTLLQIAVAPMVSAAILWLSASLGLAVLEWVDVKDPKDFLDYVSVDYFEVGWMSLLARVVGTFLMLEVVALYLVQILATLSAAVVIPLRTTGNVGRMWYVRMIRGILLGFAPLIMTFTLAASIWILQNATKFGSSSLFDFVGVITALGFAAWLPLKASKQSKEVVTKGALRLAESRVSPMRGSFREAAATGSFNAYLDRRRHRHDAIKNAAKDLAMVGIAAATGGTSAALMAGASATSNLGQKGVRAYERGQAFKAQADSFIEKRSTKRNQPKEE